MNGLTIVSSAHAMLTSNLHKTKRTGKHDHAAMIAPSIKTAQRIFSSKIYEFTADLRAWKSESNSAPADAENTE